MAHETIQSKPYLVVVVCLATFLLIWNVLSALGGWWQGYLRVLLNIAVIASVLLKYRHAKILVKVWAALPLISLGLYLASSGLRGAWNAQPFEHVVSALVALPVFLLANKVFGSPEKSNQSFKGDVAKGTHP